MFLPLGGLILPFFGARTDVPGYGSFFPSDPRFRPEFILIEGVQTAFAVLCADPGATGALSFCQDSFPDSQRVVSFYHLVNSPFTSL